MKPKEKSINLNGIFKKISEFGNNLSFEWKGFKDTVSSKLSPFLEELPNPKKEDITPVFKTKHKDENTYTPIGIAVTTKDRSWILNDGGTIK